MTHRSIVVMLFAVKVMLLLGACDGLAHWRRAPVLASDAFELVEAAALSP